MMHSMSKTPNELHSKKQSAVKMVTCGGEMVAIHACVEPMAVSMMCEWRNTLSVCFVLGTTIRGFISYTHIPGAENPVDILSKHWGYMDVWNPLLRACLFWKGDTLEMD
jgi:hypothetical protein